jgi:hypothetical protein
VNSNLDIWAIQTNKNELSTSLNTLHQTDDIIVYKNVITEFDIGSIPVKSREFDTIVSSEKNDFLGLFMHGGAVTQEDIISYLDKLNLKYTTITFAPSINDCNDLDIYREIWMIREKYVLMDALNDSLEKDNNTSFDYYPELPSNILLNYLTNNTSTSYPIDGRIFKGALINNEKVILFISQNDIRNLKSEDVISILDELEIKYNILPNESFNIDSLKTHKYTR